MQSDSEISYRIQSGTLFIILPWVFEGHMTHGYLSFVEDQYARNRFIQLCLDLNQTPTINSVGFGLVMTIHKFCNERGIALLLACENRKIINLLKLLKIYELFTIYPKSEDIPEQ